MSQAPWLAQSAQPDGPGGTTAPSMASDAANDPMARLHRRRDHAAWFIALGIGLIFLGGFGWRASWLGLPIMTGAVLITVYGLGAWSFWSIRMRRTSDPWAWDAELDGPIAEALEGQRVARPPAGPTVGVNRRQSVLGLVVAVVAAMGALWAFQRWQEFADLRWGANDPVVGPMMLAIVWGAACLGCAGLAVGSFIYAVRRMF